MSVLIVNKATSPRPTPAGESVTFEDLKRWVRTGRYLRHLLRHDDVRLRTQRLETLHKPLASALVIRAMSRGTCVLEDEVGAQVSVGGRTLATLTRTFARDLLNRSNLLTGIRSDLAALSTPPMRRPHLNLNQAPVYLRTDLVFGLASGGSVGHIAGVLNHLHEFGGRPTFITTDEIPTVDPDVETFVVRPNGRFRDFAELPSLAFNGTLIHEANRILAGKRPSFVYQRYSTENFGGLNIARAFGVPLALEYNGSEIWIGRNWGKRLVYEKLAMQIEMTNLAGADLVVVVSSVIKDDLVDRGMDAAKILVNPNGVDTDRYAPTVDGSAIRARYGLDGALVVGFIGTFGRWHGAEVLADAFGRLVRRRPDLRDRLRLLMIGDGAGRAATCDIAERAGVADLTVFTGSTAQADGPVHLAAADILVSPHVPNPDGTPFFGSPTKLFEYMAMGKPIVASDLDQIGEVLDHDRTAWLVRPGDPDALAAGIERLIDDPERAARLGAAAREDAVAHHTWREHTRRIVEALRERCA